MNNTCPQPGCGAVYNVTPQHIGRRMNCKRCGTALMVTVDGIQFADALPAGGPLAAAAAQEDEALQQTPSQRLRSLGGGFAFPNIFAKLPDLPTWFFGAGAFIVIIFMFFPLIDQAKVTRRQGAITEGENREKRLEREHKEKKEPSAKDEETRSKARENWKKERVTLEESVEAAQVSQQTAGYWYRWGMMFGFLLLAAAALSYLNPEQPTIRRVVGAIVIVAEVLLIFIVFVFGSVRFL